MRRDRRRCHRSPNHRQHDPRDAEPAGQKQESDAPSEMVGGKSAERSARSNAKNLAGQEPREDRLALLVRDDVADPCHRKRDDGSRGGPGQSPRASAISARVRRRPPRRSSAVTVLRRRTSRPRREPSPKRSPGSVRTRPAATRTTAQKPLRHTRCSRSAAPYSAAIRGKIRRSVTQASTPNSRTPRRRAPQSRRPASPATIAARIEGRGMSSAERRASMPPSSGSRTARAAACSCLGTTDSSASTTICAHRNGHSSGTSAASRTRATTA